MQKPRYPPPGWSALYQRYEQFTLLSIPPRAGGLNDQDPFEIRLFAAIRGAEDSVSRDQGVELTKKAGPLGSLLALTVLKR
ncbi:MAG: hypothetical protein MI923_16255 [Phycisphaerales bacterium]|nr:hypothetical protein [Phycisphaerales bacterium]